MALYDPVPFPEFVFYFFISSSFPSVCALNRTTYTQFADLSWGSFFGTGTGHVGNDVD
jgi:hypothetical protein